MRPVASTAGPPAPTASHKGGPAVRGQARAAEVHALKAQGLSPSRCHWREAAVAPAPAATPAVEVSFSAEATAALAAEAATAPVEAAPALTAATPVVDTAPAIAEAAPSITEAILDEVSAEPAPSAV